MKLYSYLSFNGNCEAAFAYYAQVLGGKVGDKMTYGESPMADQVPEEWRDKIMHSQLILGDQELMGADSMPEYFEEPKGTSVLIAIEDPDKAEHVFAALAENGTIKMPIQETFWAARFGMVVDQFGTPWLINCDRPA
ncbi:MULTISPECIES: VOC family protein [Cyanophyceae]|uniref:VOC family protein n=1 Tax=Cyanophyceae TaxID=3028117 RepID=UPI0016893D7C|nr:MULTISPECIES: VOC family protein [Cyanophyceae]MBD1915716.1 VOC family protein [Phormidium sp. FACHB-77]MBD2029035.1 VOC family protein [Phormidium sp. FACHB-322]MBD2052208.1 VOC family protein [Leptolyngbya sp. FACHB-60]